MLIPLKAPVFLLSALLPIAGYAQTWTRRYDLANRWSDDSVLNIENKSKEGDLYWGIICIDKRPALGLATLSTILSNGRLETDVFDYERRTVGDRTRRTVSVTFQRLTDKSTLSVNLVVIESGSVGMANFTEQHRAFLRAADGGTVLIRFPVFADGTKIATFDMTDYVANVNLFMRACTT